VEDPPRQPKLRLARRDSSSTSPGADPNDVRELLKRNVASEKATESQIDVSNYKSRSRLRTRKALLALLLVDPPLLLLAWHAGPREPYAFVASLSAFALLTSWICWNAWFLNTD
jgi:hypothetical protein